MNRTVACLLVLVAAAALAFAPRSTSRFEYRFIRLRDAPERPAPTEPTPSAEQVTNAFGRDGWELDQVETSWVSTLNDEHASVLLVFKRER